MGCRAQAGRRELGGRMKVLTSHKIYPTANGDHLIDMHYADCRAGPWDWTEYRRLIAKKKHIVPDLQPITVRYPHD